MSYLDKIDNLTSASSHNENAWHITSGSCLLGFFVPGHSLLLKAAVVDSIDADSNEVPPPVVSCLVSELFRSHRRAKV